MQAHRLTDQLLLEKRSNLVHREREILTEVLRHLREVERRKLFSELGYSSLFDYATRELKYSEGQAERRIQAMRLVKELPEIEQGITSGELSLSNLSSAQSLFRNIRKSDPRRITSRQEKVSIINSLKNKSAREGQKEILKWQPQGINAAQFEKERQVTPDACEVRFLMTDQMRAKLENVRSLLGPKAVDMGYAELFETMAELSAAKLEEKKFGKKASKAGKTPTVEERKEKVEDFQSQNRRYIPKKLKAAVWRRDQGQCGRCHGKRNLNYDHVKPVALGGETTLENLRLLCFHCNQRQAVKTFGVFSPTG